MKIKKRILSLALAGTMALGLMPGMTMTALADGDTSYTLTIPSTLTVADKGWNATDGISATGTLASGKKLTVTAASANSWALKSGDNSVGYNLATATGTYSNSATPASWEFTELTNTATNKPMGIIVEDYSSKPAGDYSDTVTFTAKVEDAVSASLSNIKNDGAVLQVAFKQGDTPVQVSIKNNGGTLSCTEYRYNNYSLPTGSNTVSLSGDELSIRIPGLNTYEFKFNLNDNTYTKSQNITDVTSVVINDFDITSELSNS